MAESLWHELTQHGSLREQLLATGDAELVEESEKRRRKHRPRDLFDPRAHNINNAAQFSSSFHSRGVYRGSHFGTETKSVCDAKAQ